MTDEIMQLEKQVFELTTKLNQLRKTSRGSEVKNYRFDTLDGQTTLRDMFGDHKQLLVIHNMGQGCRYCTLWADGFNGVLAHLESAMAVVMVSKDSPDVQREFANSRGWRFRLASHGGGDYISEQTVMDAQSNMPGAVVYERDGDRMTRKNAAIFGPGDMYCPTWNLLSMAGLDESDWTPQFQYWTRPKALDDGGQNVLE